eukprot:c1876_g1_i1 orf=176-511(+)
MTTMAIGSPSSPCIETCSCSANKTWRHVIILIGQQKNDWLLRNSWPSSTSEFPLCRLTKRRDIIQIISIAYLDQYSNHHSFTTQSTWAQASKFASQLPHQRQHSTNAHTYT